MKPVKKRTSSKHIRVKSINVQEKEMQPSKGVDTLKAEARNLLSTRTQLNKTKASNENDPNLIGVDKWFLILLVVVSFVSFAMCIYLYYVYMHHTHDLNGKAMLHLPDHMALHGLFRQAVGNKIV
jgi:hypothetical protein